MKGLKNQMNPTGAVSPAKAGSRKIRILWISGQETAFGEGKERNRAEEIGKPDELSDWKCCFLYLGPFFQMVGFKKWIQQQ